MILRLDALKAHNLKSLAFLIGCATPTTKAALVETIQCSLQSPRLRQARVLSIDMGIKNFAYCILERGEQAQQGFNIDTWTKRNLLADLKASRRGKALPSDDTTLSEADDTIEDVSSAELFNPPNVSRMACKLTDHLLEYKPDIILIEQQRFRSGGGSAIQEWTIRVNMLESMLWACLESRRQSDNPALFPSTFSISPTKVARFWVGGLGLSMSPQSALAEIKSTAAIDDKGPKKITKADKMNVLKAWLDQTDPNAMPITFSDGAQSIAELFKKTPRRSKDSADLKSRTKLDDYTDCVLQGAAWLRWERNRAELATMFNTTATADSNHVV